MLHICVAQHINLSPNVHTEIIEILQIYASFRAKSVNILSENEKLYKNITNQSQFLADKNFSKEYQLHFIPYYTESIDFKIFSLPKKAVIFNLETTQDEKYEL